jgi:hypothetical protein
VLAPGGVLLLDVRDWLRTAIRKRAEPITERTPLTSRGRLSFRSDTRLDRSRRRLVVRELTRVTLARHDVVVTNTFVMGCWTPAELRRRLRRAGFVSVRYLSAARAALPSDRLFAIATR